MLPFVRATRLDVHLPARTGVTAAEYLALPDDSPRCELIEGDLWMSPAPFDRHQLVVQHLFRLLDRHVRRTRCGRLHVAPLDVVFGDGNVLQPDVVFFRKGRLPAAPLDQVIRLAPDLCAEIVSGDSAVRDLVRKRRIYERHGVREYWVADPVEKTFAFYRLAARHYVEVEARRSVFISDAVPGFRLRTAAFWRDALRVD